MEGPSFFDRELMGVNPRMVETIFAHVMDADENSEFILKCSMIEIYMERIRDLLNPSKVN
jgi:kinesin family protein 5